MRKVFLMLTVSLFSLNAEAQECVDAPSCTDLGYTQTEADCPNGAVKCPWNSGLVFCGCGEGYQYSCTGTNESPSSAKCGDYYASCNCDSGYKWENGSCVSSRPKCNIGDIYYTDNTCVPADKHDSSKTALGVVVYVTDGGKHGQIMAPGPIDENGNVITEYSTSVKWGQSGDISTLPNYSGAAEIAARDYDSCGNTDKIVAAGDASAYPAAWATRKYAPTPGTSGMWCLPAAGIMSNINSNQTIIQNGFAAMGGVLFPSCCPTSSTEYDEDRVWHSLLNSPGNGTGLISSAKYLYSIVRPVMEF